MTAAQKATLLELIEDECPKLLGALQKAYDAIEVRSDTAGDDVASDDLYDAAIRNEDAAMRLVGELFYDLVCAGSNPAIVVDERRAKRAVVRERAKRRHIESLEQRNPEAAALSAELARELNAHIEERTTTPTLRLVQGGK